MKPPDWMMSVGAAASVIYNIWYLSALVRWVTRKGSLPHETCKSLMCEVRPVFWYAYAVSQFVYQADWASKQDHSWWETPPAHWFFTLLDLGCVVFYWRMFKDDEDDDRWQRRKRRLSSTIKKRLHLHRPVFDQG